MNQSTQPVGLFSRATGKFLWVISYCLWRIEAALRWPIAKLMGVEPLGPMNDVELKAHAKLVVKLRAEGRISPFDVPNSLLALALNAVEDDANLPAFRTAASIEAK